MIPVLLRHSVLVRLLGAGLLLALSPVVVRAQEDTSSRPHYPRTLEEGEPPILPSDRGERPAAAPDLEGVQADGGVIAYQSYKDGNWEIYVTADVTGAPRRLTADPSSDIEPSLSVDMTRVVFTSRRAGNYDLFSLGVDGTGLRQLTDSAATDSAAVWSPDGTRIAFQSNRGGNYDVYVMNADGSGLTQLTTSADYDGEPTWSPDGAQIAFVSRRSNTVSDFFIYVMNADGGGQRLVAAVPNSANPAWSYNGRRILFDGLSSSGWQRLYAVDVATGGITRFTFFDSDFYVDVFAGAWGINDVVYVTRVQYVEYSGQWYLKSFRIYSARLDAPAPETFQLIGDADAFPTWSNPDHDPPVTFLTAAQAYMQTGGYNSFWVVVYDRPTAARGVVEAQMRIDGSPWGTLLGSCSPNGSIRFSCLVWVPQSAGLVEYRVRGRDTFGNEESWPEDPAAWGRSRAMARYVSGSVTDMRGLPLALVPIMGLDAVEGNVVSDGGGFWSGHRASPETTFPLSAGVADTVVTITAPTLLDNGLLTAGFRLPVAGNAIVNPGFETPGVGWSAGDGASLNWLDVTQSQADSAVLRLAGSDGHTLVPGVYSTATSVVSGTATLLAYRDNSGSYFSPCLPVGECGIELLGTGLSPRDLAIRPDGTIGLIETNDDGTRGFRQRSPSGVWTSVEAFPFRGTGSGHRLLADGTGRWHYVWAEADGMVHVTRREDDGTWGGATQAGLMPLGSDAVFDSSNVLHIVGCPLSGVVEATWSEPVGMSSLAPVSSETCTGYYLGATIDTSGRIDAAWVTNGVARFSRRGTDGVWGPPIPAMSGIPVFRQILNGPDGRVMILTQTESGGCVALQAAADGAAWEVLPHDVPPFRPALVNRQVLAANWAASTLLVWEEGSGTWPDVLHLAVYGISAHAGPVRANQVVTIPVDMHRPLLTAEYRFVGSDPNDMLAIGVQGPGQDTPMTAVLPAGVGWQHAWFDASAWAGQTVTVTLQMIDGGLNSGLVADFNEVDLGAWTTPVATGLSPAVLPASTGSIVITGDNFIGTPTVTIGGRVATVVAIDAQHLSVTVPSGLGLGRYAVIVSNGGWATASAQSLQIGQSVVMLPTLLRWTP